MNVGQAQEELETRRAQFLSRIPAHAPRMRERYLREMVEEQIEAARKHLLAIYQNQLEVGSKLTPLPEHAEHPKYSFWIAGIARHLQECDAILAEQPDDANGSA